MKYNNQTTKQTKNNILHKQIHKQQQQTHRNVGDIEKHNKQQRPNNTKNNHTQQQLHNKS